MEPRTASSTVLAGPRVVSHSWPGGRSRVHSECSSPSPGAGGGAKGGATASAAAIAAALTASSSLAFCAASNSAFLALASSTERITLAIPWKWDTSWALRRPGSVAPVTHLHGMLTRTQ